MNIENLYNIDDKVDKEVYLKYIMSLESQIYKTLCAYESCENSGDFEPWKIYLDGLICQITGDSLSFKNPLFINLRSTLIGLSKKDDLSKKKVKSIIFGCCNKLNRVRDNLKEN